MPCHSDRSMTSLSRSDVPYLCEVTDCPVSKNLCPLLRLMAFLSLMIYNNPCGLCVCKYVTLVYCGYWLIVHIDRA